jgi:hypothetical protein
MSAAFFLIMTELDIETPLQDIRHNLEHEAELNSSGAIIPLIFYLMYSQYFHLTEIVSDKTGRKYGVKVLITEIPNFAVWTSTRKKLHAAVHTIISDFF